MSRKDLIVGNWKMNATHLEAIQMVQKLSYRLEPSDYDRVEVVVVPPFTALRSVQTVIEADHLLIRLGAQDVHWEQAGAFTGEVSPSMLAKLSVSFVIVGHSERRHIFGEDDLSVNHKVRAVLASEMIPILCVGETLEEREADETTAVVERQTRDGIKHLSFDQVGQVVVAYEPVWAIGTGRTAGPDDAGTVAKQIRGILGEHGPADEIRILYGGSVNAGNITAFMAKREIDGALVGGTSLDPDAFAATIRYWT